MANVYFKKEIPGRALIIGGNTIPVETLSRDVGVLKLDTEQDAALIGQLNMAVGRKGLVKISAEEYDELKKKSSVTESPSSSRVNAKLGIHPSSQKRANLPANVADQAPAPANKPEPELPAGNQSTLRRFVPRTLRQSEVSRLDSGAPAT